MVRNPGKFGKAKRGGGRHFSRDLSRLDADGRPQGEQGDDSSDEDGSDASQEEDEEENEVINRVGQLPPTGEEGSEGEDSGIMSNLNSTLSTTSVGHDDPTQAALARRGNVKTADEVARARKEKKAALQQRKVNATTSTSKGSGDDSSDGFELDHGNNANKANKSLKIGDLGAPKEMSRREREQAEKKAAAERYARMHAAGKTDEAKSDLARLAEIRKQREQAAARRKAETDATEAAKKVAVEKSGKKLGPGRK